MKTYIVQDGRLYRRADVTPSNVHDLMAEMREMASLQRRGLLTEAQLESALCKMMSRYISCR